MATRQLAVVFGVRIPALDCVALCDVWSFSVMGGDVNDRSNDGRDVRIVARAYGQNLPRRPGASDAYRSYKADSGSAREPMSCVTWQLEMRDIRAAIGIGKNIRLSTDGDDMHYYFETTTGKPSGEILITGWADKDD